MIDCQFERTVFGRFRCQLCGTELPIMARRNCKGGSPEQNRVIQSRQEMLGSVTKQCVKCERFPCLGDKDCSHEAALRQGVQCPDALWFYC